MLEALKHIESTTLPALLDTPEPWSTLDITYHPPHVERLWTTVPEGRVFLHHIEPCEPGEALFHPHDWPSAMKILRGRYEHGIGIATGIASGPDADANIETLSVAELAPGTYYEMSNPRVWHWVRPLESVYTLMLAGPLYGSSTRQDFAKPDERQGPLAPARAHELRAIFAQLLSE